jgi:hypothetical protein
MPNRFVSMITAALAGAGIAALAVPPAMAQAPGKSDSTQNAAMNTPWGEPDLQGIWTDETDTPLQRPPEYANRESFTAAERDQLDRERSALLRRDKRVERGTELDVAGAYNGLFQSYKRSGFRTSLIIDPPNGRLPAMTPEAQKIAAAERQFRLALLQATETCKSKSVACAGGTYDPTPSPRLAEPPPRYNTARMNRHDNPEDGALADRCLTLGLPEFGAGTGSFRRIVQTPGGISIFYDVGQGQGWQRNIVMNGSPHLPATIRQWYGDSRGHWEGNTLVVDVTNFSAKTDYQGSRENMHLVERWTRTGPTTLEYVAIIEDPTVWTRPWTAKQEYTLQSGEENRLYTEPRCVEGNYGHPGLMKGARAEEIAYREGRGPHPATKDNATDFVGVEEDPLR